MVRSFAKLNYEYSLSLLCKVVENFKFHTSKQLALTRTQLTVKLSILKLGGEFYAKYLLNVSFEGKLIEMLLEDSSERIKIEVLSPEMNT